MNRLKGLDPALSRAAAAFNQKCAVAGGRADGQADYCAALPCDGCNDKDAPGCGWCSDRNTCSNECVSTKGQCGARHSPLAAPLLTPPTVGAVFNRPNPRRRDGDARQSRPLRCGHGLRGVRPPTPLSNVYFCPRQA